MIPHTRGHPQIQISWGLLIWGQHPISCPKDPKIEGSPFGVMTKYGPQWENPKVKRSAKRKTSPAFGGQPGHQGIQQLDRQHGPGGHHHEAEEEGPAPHEGAAWKVTEAGEGPIILIKDMGDRGQGNENKSQALVQQGNRG